MGKTLKQKIMASALVVAIIATSINLGFLGRDKVGALSLTTTQLFTQTNNGTEYYEENGNIYWMTFSYISDAYNRRPDVVSWDIEFTANNGDKATMTMTKEESLLSNMSGQSANYAHTYSYDTFYMSHAKIYEFLKSQPNTEDFTSGDITISISSMINVLNNNAYYAGPYDMNSSYDKNAVGNLLSGQPSELTSLDRYNRKLGDAVDGELYAPTGVEYTIYHNLEDSSGNYVFHESTTAFAPSSTSITDGRIKYSGYNLPAAQTIILGQSLNAITYNYPRTSYDVTLNFTHNGGESVSYGIGQTHYDDIKISADYLSMITPADYVAVKRGTLGAYDPDENPSGWQFMGWNTDPNALIGMDELIVDSENIVLYAIFVRTMSVVSSFINGENPWFDEDNMHEYVLNHENSIVVTTPDAPPVSNTIDSYGGSWTFAGWTNSPSVVQLSEYPLLAAGENIEISTTTGFYAVYTRDVPVFFSYYNGPLFKTIEASVTQTMHTATLEEILVDEAMAPTADILIDLTGDGEWSFHEWRASTTLDEGYALGDDIPYNELARLEFFAIYKRDISLTYHSLDNGIPYSETLIGEQYTSSADATNISAVDIVNPTPKTTGTWESYGWTDTQTSVRREQAIGFASTIYANSDLYAVYLRDAVLGFNSFDVDGKTPVRTVETATQFANSSDILGTATSVSVYAPTMNNYIDDDGNVWTGQLWTSDTNPDSEDGFTFTDDVVANDSTEFYLRYHRPLTATFRSLLGNSNNVQSRYATAYLNSYDTSDILPATVIAPDLAIALVDGLTWDGAGWTTGTTANSDIEAIAPAQIEIVDNTIFYGIYTNGTTVSFVDYNGTDKIITTRAKETVMTSFDKSTSSSSETTAPEIQQYLSEDVLWNALGWTSSGEPGGSIAMQPGDSIPEGTTSVYYALYGKNVSITYNEYDGDIQSSRIEYSPVLANASNIENVLGFDYTMSELSLSTVEGKDWTSTGWNLSTISTISINYMQNQSIKPVKNMELYGQYSGIVTVAFDGNGGTAPSAITTPVYLNASGDKLTSNTIVPSTTPSRQGYSFYGVYGTESNGGDEYSLQTSYLFEEDTTLYALWYVETVDLTAELNWIDINNFLGSRPDEVFVILYRDGVQVADSVISELGDSVVSPSVNNKIPSAGKAFETSLSDEKDLLTFEDLQKYSPVDGHAFDYVIELVELGSQDKDVSYVLSYKNNSWTIYATLLNSGTKSIEGTINFFDDNDVWHFRPTSIEVSLLRKNPTTGTVYTTSRVLNTTNGNSINYSFENLDTLNEMLVPYEYSLSVGVVPFYNKVETSGMTTDGTIYFNYDFTLASMPPSFTGGDRNFLTISADVYNHMGNLADLNDYFAMNTTEEQTMLITLKEVQKSWEGTGVDAVENYDNNTYTGHEYNIVACDDKDTVVDYLSDGRYEITTTNSLYFDYQSFESSISEITNADVFEEDGRFFITFSSQYDYSAILSLHAKVLMSSWRGYSDMKDTYRLKDYTIL